MEYLPTFAQNISTNIPNMEHMDYGIVFINFPYKYILWQHQVFATERSRKRTNQPGLAERRLDHLAKVSLRSLPSIRVVLCGYSLHYVLGSKGVYVYNCLQMFLNFEENASWAKFLCSYWIILPCWWVQFPWWAMFWQGSPISQQRGRPGFHALGQ